jgi:hypothetical protein
MNELIAWLPPVVIFVGVCGLIYKIAIRPKDQRDLDKLLAETKAQNAADKK